jgi:hypothetical protein
LPFCFQLENNCQAYCFHFQQALTKDSAQFKKGVLSTLAGVFKHGQREQMMEHAHAVLRTILTIKFQPSELLIQLRNRW